MDASVVCIDFGVLLGLAEVHSDRVHGAGEPWGGAEARSKILRVWVGSGVHRRRVLNRGRVLNRRRRGRRRRRYPDVKANCFDVKFPKGGI